MRIGPLYHWSPTERRAAILAEGLVPGRPCVTATTELPYVCLGFSASGAWSLSADTIGEHTEHDVWDLWQVAITDEDSVEIRPEFGNLLCEAMVHGTIPPRQLWLVGTRALTSG